MIAQDLQSLTPGNMVTLFELDTTVIGGADILRFHPGTSALNGDVTWGGHEYARFPVEASGFERSTNGALPRPKLLVANVDGLMGALSSELGGIEGSKLTRTRTFVKYLDGVNFPGGVNPTADPEQYIEKDIWFVSRKSGENRIFLEYELSSNIDLAGVKIPRRQIIQNVCAWRYRSPECSYTGPAVARENDLPTTDLAQDKCGKRLSSCKLRHGATSVLPYGGFPGAGLMR